MVSSSATKSDNGLVVAVGHPGVLLYHAADGLHSRQLRESIVVKLGGVECLALGGLNHQMGVEGVEKGLRQLADAVVDTQHDDERHGAYRDADK